MEKYRKGLGNVQRKPLLNLGSGESVNFWLDKWIGPAPLRNYLIGPLSKGEENKTLADLSIDKVIDLNTFPPNIPKELLNLAQTISLSDEPDHLVSSRTCAGKFNNKDAIAHIQSKRLNNQKAFDCNWNIIWNALGHPKFKLLHWQSWWDRNPTNENLFFRNCVTSSECNTCSHAKETMLHIMRDCPRASSVWNKLNRPLWTSNQFLHCWLEENLSLTDSRHGRIPWNVLFSFALWEIWKRRNKWIFKKKNENEDVFVKNLTWFPQEWFFAQPNTKKTNTKNKNTHRWQPPPFSLRKINVDASYMVSNLVTSIGSLCWLDTRSWIKGFIAKKSFSRNSKIAEIQDILLGLASMGTRRSLERLHYCVGLHPSSYRDKLQWGKDQVTRIIKNCRMLLEQDGGTLIHEKREANAPADEMTRLVTHSFYGIERILIPHPACTKLIMADNSLEPNSDSQNSEPVNSIRTAN